MSDRRLKIREQIKAGSHDDALSAISSAAREALSYSELLSLCRLRRKLPAEVQAPGARRVVKIALLGGASTEMLAAPLELLVEASGLTPVLHRSDFNAYAMEMLQAGSDTDEFGPDVAVLVLTPANIHDWPTAGESREQVWDRVDRVCEHWLGLCRALHERTRCEIVLDNFHQHSTRALGNLGAKLPWDPMTFTRAVNLELGLRAPDYVHVHDVDALASRRGTEVWFDPRFWHHAKQPMSNDSLPEYVRSLSTLIGGLFGLSRKCLVTDLDNTLWGGVIGDDGLDGIRIGEGDAVGEAFKAFQSYLLQLKNRGVLLAVCSKNEEANALEPFEKHPEMVLRRDDFVAFKANWDPKPDNLVAIARELNIGIDSLAFVDDNPVERDHVRQRLPEVRVIELTEDPSDYVGLLDRDGCFEVPAISAEDADRTHQYQANAERDQLRESVTDYSSYLASLDQRAVIAPFLETDFDRITQLVNKSNQFNLTTRRLSRSQVEVLANAPDRLCRTARLTDRFGDNGLILVFSAELREFVLDIDLWLMSCRVLKRGMESFLMNHVVEAAREMGASEISGTYIPTAKNGLVSDLYGTLGFTMSENESDGTSRWTLCVDDYEPVEVQIEEEASHGDR